MMLRTKMDFILFDD